MLFSVFLGKNVFFSVECPIFPGKHYYSEGFGHKKNFFSFKVCYSVLISWKKKFLSHFAQHKFYSYMYYCSHVSLNMYYCPHVSLNMIKIYRNND